MKLLIITVVDEFKKDIQQLFKESEIKNFSTSNIEGFKTVVPVITGDNWFSNKRNTTDSQMFFSFTESKKIDALFPLIKQFNSKLKTNNPIKAVVVPIEKFI